MAIRFCSGRPFRSSFKGKPLIWRHFSSSSRNSTEPKPQNLPDGITTINLYTTIALAVFKLKLEKGWCHKLADDSLKRTEKQKKQKNEKKGSYKWVITVILLTFAISSVFQMIQSGLMSSVNLLVAFIILISFVMTGIVFDIIGVAVTSANETPFHALSSRKKRGAKESVRLIRNADKVGSFCNDVIGDIVGIISGSATTAIVIKIYDLTGVSSEFMLTVVLTAIVAALTIGGKALGKRKAIEKSHEVVFFVGKLISFIAPVKEKNKL